MDLKVLLVDVDSTIPNLALMRISSYHKIVGDTITLFKCNIKLYAPKRVSVDLSGYDRCYISCIFDNTFKYLTINNPGNIPVDIGGSGVDLHKTLPDGIAQCKPDYSVYPENDTSYGFISRGCIRNCEFCIVRKKEGYLRQVAEPEEIIQHKTVKFLDNNFLALPNHKELLQRLIHIGKRDRIKFQFNQGLDIRLIDEANARMLSFLPYIGEYIFAFDDLKLQGFIEGKLRILKEYIPQPWKIKFFIYCHPSMDLVSDVYHRIMWCKENKCLPYFMRDVSCWGAEHDHIYKDFSAWCNQPGIFKSHTYKEFLLKRSKNQDRIEKSLQLLGL
jgi:hypothetical protein